MSSGIRLIDENFLIPGRAFIFTDSVMNPSIAPAGSMFINPNDGSIKIKKISSPTTWSNLDISKIFGDKSVTSTMLSDAAIVNAKISDNAVSFAKLDTSLQSTINSTVKIISSAINIVVPFTTTAKVTIKETTIDNNILTTTTVSCTNVGATNIGATATITGKDIAATNSITALAGSITTLSTTNGTVNKDLSVAYQTTTNTLTVKDSATITNTLTANTLTLNKAFNAMYKDLAEAFLPDEKIEIGDIVAINSNGKVVRAETENNIIGVHSDMFANVFGASKEELDNGSKVAIGVIGQIPTKIVGTINAGDKVTLCKSGVGMKRAEQSNAKVIGIALESKSKSEVDLVNCFIIANLN